MKRDLVQMANQRYDILIIGGGIYGACIAWDAALRGLSVALVEKGDFGHATSANSLKTVHGGLRYLQDVNPKLMRTMSEERRTWMRIAPHLVHPLPCLVPTYKKLTRSKSTLAIALVINDLVSYDRNGLKDSQKQLPNGRTISRAECLRLLPGIPGEEITGGAIWYDAQIYNSERLLLSIILSAAEAGAAVANYVEVTDLLQDDSGIKGIAARDVLTGQEFEVQAKLVVNSAGAWVDSILGFLNGRSLAPKFGLSTALNLVTRQVLSEYAVGISSRYASPDEEGNLSQHSRMLFIAPWRQYSIIGTIHAPYVGRPQDFQISEDVIADFVDEINTAFPGAALTRQDVYHIHSGFLPMITNSRQENVVKLVRQGYVYDHELKEGVTGLITVIGVKYTTARHIAQKAVGMAIRKLGRKASPCQTQKTPVFGGQTDQFDGFLAQAIKQRPFGLSPEIMEHLVYNYGSEYPQILEYVEKVPAWGQTVSEVASVLKAEVIHAIREEMAHKLTDVVQRRTEIGAAGLPDQESLHVCAELMATELGWTQTKKEQELDDVYAVYDAALAPTREGIGVS
jgi:glycerol-3-phosphate dehydrogenase